MKYLLITFAFILFISNAYAQIDPISMEGKLKTVTVYPEQARLEYQGTLSLPVGESKVVFTNLPPKIDKESIQLELSEASASIENIVAAKNYLKSKTEEAELKRLKQQQDSLQKVLTWANQQKEILEGAEALLKANQQVYSQQAGVTVAALKDLLTFYREETTRIRRERIANDALLKTTQEGLAAIQRQIVNMQAAEHASVTEVTVDFRSQKAVRLNYTLSMLAPDAYWSAVYDIHANAPDAPLQVRFRAVVRQTTGENWKDVVLHLSTAQPGLDNRRPYLEPRYARIMHAQLDTVITFDPVTYNEPLQVVKTEPTEELWSDRTYNLTSSTFTLSGTQTIPSDGAEHYATVRDLSIPAKMQHYAIPRASPHVYLLAEILNNSDYDLQSGSARIFNGSTYIGETWLDIESLTDTLQISLGIDQGIYMKRERRDFGASQWLGSYRQETFDFAISLRNNKPVPVDIKLLDQIPISTDKQIEISLLKKDNAQYNEADGMLTWQVRCAPASTETRAFSYRVKYPKDAVVEGKW